MKDVYYSTAGKYLLFIALLAALNLIVYSKSLSGEFIWDDRAQISDNQFIRDIKYIPDFFLRPTWDLSASSENKSPYFRPIFLFSAMLDYALYGPGAFGYHLTNLFLHLACSLMFFVIMRQIIQEDISPFLAALLFSVHPVSSEPVAWISARMDSLYTLFFLIALFAYMRYRDTENIRYLIISFIAYVFSLLSKEPAVLLPVILFFYELLLTDRKRMVLKPMILYLSFTAVYFLIRFQIFASFTGIKSDFSVSKSLAMAGNYIVMLIWPVGIKIQYKINGSVLNNELIFSAVLLAFFIIGILYAFFKKKKVLLFSGIWFCALLLPVTGIVGSSRYMYLPSMGIFLSVAFALSGIKQNMLKIAVAIPLFVFFAVNSYARTEVYRNNLALFFAMTRQTPSLAGAWRGLGNAFLEQKDLNSATNAWETYLSLPDKEERQHISSVQSNLGNAYSVKGDHQKAASYYNDALLLNPRNFMAHFNLAVAFERLGFKKDAIRHYEEFIRLAPSEYDFKKLEILDKIDKQ